MPPVSKVRKLPQILRDLVHRRLDKGVPSADIAEELRAKGQEISASGVGRYRHDWQESIKDLAEAREFAEEVVRNLAEQPEGKGARLNAELLQAMLQTALMAMRNKDLDPETIIKILLKGAMTQQMISRAAKDDTDMQIKSASFREARQAKDGDLLTKKDGKLVRVEFIEPAKPEKERGVTKKLAAEKKAAKEKKTK